jgi:hypothetical protein
MAQPRPIACTLNRADLRDREAAWRKLFASGLLSREHVPGGIRLSAEPGALDALRELIDLERDCCPWIDYDVDAGGATLTAVGDGEAVLAEMFASLRPRPPGPLR